METGRDLACPALWQESLERSLARRGRATRSSLELSHLRPERDLSRPDLLRESLAYSQLRRSAATRRPSMAVPGAGGISALALLAAATLPGLAGAGRSRQAVAIDHAAAADAGTVGGTTPSAPNDRGHLAAVDPAPALAVAPAGPVRGPTGAGLQSRGIGGDATPRRPRAAQPAHIGSASSSSRHSVRTLPPAKASGRVAIARDASGGVAHALSGGAAPAAPKLSATAPRVPAEPQPTGHPSTGGGAIEAVSHSPSRSRHPPTRRATTHPVAATTHPVAAPTRRRRRARPHRRPPATTPTLWPART